MDLILIMLIYSNFDDLIVIMIIYSNFEYLILIMLFYSYFDDQTMWCPIPIHHPYRPPLHNARLYAKMCCAELLESFDTEFACPLICLNC